MPEDTDAVKSRVLEASYVEGAGAAVFDEDDVRRRCRVRHLLLDRCGDIECREQRSLAFEPGEPVGRR
jgi:hypothetical protein